LFNRIVINTYSDISIEGSLFSGQTFRWRIIEEMPEYFINSINSIPIIIRQLKPDTFEAYYETETTTDSELSELLIAYFQLDLSPENLFPEEFSRRYPEVWQKLENYLPLRVLRQDPFEALITFMCAQGIGMQIIRRQIEMISRVYGKERSVFFNGREVTLFSFPAAISLADADPEKLSRCTNNNRTRARNIITAARSLAQGKLDFEKLRDKSMPLEELRNELCKLGGIGFKIADCIALFGLGRMDAFPIDTHVKQYLGKWFGIGADLQSLTPAAYLKLDAEARKILNPCFAGYAGHILFHCWRCEEKRLRTC
jgi:N-glycosylase/DNA lyase